ncbi:hypothetical protein IFM89_031411 [Coptis chinensis]|uniref:Transcription factor CBF/NF-Y/archaeal histone domain-containing protein n=1 Tax=Coptis chinensis TaxID=261450 RepID=A0A835HIG9_9MAGN|nr:hypothetical protein IFM89_031411 [Coptis chinensis]
MASKVPMAVAVEELPKAIVRRVVKDKLSNQSTNDQSTNEQGDSVAIHKDALLAFSESARIFIHYLSATANDICKESKRQTINADDVLKAIEEIEFPEFVGPLKASLDDFRWKNAGKKAGAAKANETKKRKVVEKHSEQTENEEDAGEDMDEEANEDENGTPDD